MRFSVGAVAWKAEKKAAIVVPFYASGDDKDGAGKAGGGKKKGAAKPKVKAPKLTGHAKAVDEEADGAITRAFTRGLFAGGKGETLAIPGWADTTLILVGLGKKDKVELEQFRTAAAAALRHADKWRHETLVSLLHDAAASKEAPVEVCAEATVLGWSLARYSFDRFKGKNGGGKAKGKKADNDKETVRTIRLVAADAAHARRMKPAVERGRLTAEATIVARDLANTPANVATPDWLAKQAKSLAAKHGLRYRVLGKPEMQRHGMGGLLGVNQGSAQPPRLVVLEHKPARVRAKPYRRVALVGKGITFDSGGISIKPAASMELMKYDKCGACAVIGAMVGVAKLKLPVHVIGVAAFTENLPSGTAYKPGDILDMANGKTVEVLNTDAEGRLILGDALWYAQRSKPDAIIDLATLTGAIDVALGPAYTGLMGSDQVLIDRLKEAGAAAGEKMWHMPLGDEYQDMIKGSHADLNNIGGRSGGALTAGQFLRNFVEEDKVAWAHMDIAATAWVEKDLAYTPKGCTGVGVRSLLGFLRSLSES